MKIEFTAMVTKNWDQGEYGPRLCKVAQLYNNWGVHIRTEIEEILSTEFEAAPNE